MNCSWYEQAHTGSEAGSGVLETLAPLCVNNHTVEVDPSMPHAACAAAYTLIFFTACDSQSL